MRRDELSELHCIAPIENIPSILGHGILSHDRAATVTHVDVSSGVIQDRRVGRKVPDARLRRARRLHEYANLYICGRNPMLYVLRHLHRELAVLRVRSEVIDLDGVVVADGNASSDYTRFHEPGPGLEAIDRDITFAGDPRAPSYHQFLDRKRRMCAEVLIPDAVPPSFVTGAFVSCSESEQRCRALGICIPIEIRPEFFYNP